MASTFGKSFGKSFNIGLQQAMQSARDDAREERLSARMKEEREEARGEALLKELGATGADVSSFRRQGGGYYTEAAEKELAEAQRQAIAGRAAAHSSTGGGIGVLAGPSEGAGASEGAYYKAFAAGQLERGVEAARYIAENERLQKAQQIERDRADSEAIGVSSASVDDGWQIDYNRKDWRQQEANIRSSKAHDIERASVGMAPYQRPNVNAGYPEKGEVFDPTPLPAEAFAQLAAFKEAKGIKDAAIARAVTVSESEAALSKTVNAQYATLTPNLKRIFDEYYPGQVTADPQMLASQLGRVSELEKLQTESLSASDKSNTTVYNNLFSKIPSGTMTYDPDTGGLVPFRVRRDSRSGAYNSDDMEKLKNFLKEVPDPQGLGAPSKWMWEEPPPKLSGQPPPTVEQRAFFPTPDGSKPKPPPPEEEESNRAWGYWSGLGVSEPAFKAAKNIFDSIKSDAGKRYVTSKDAELGESTDIYPLAGGIGDVNLKHEQLVDAAMGRVKAKEFIIDARIERARELTRSHRERRDNTSPNELGDLDKKIKESIASEVGDVKELLRLRKLRNELTRSMGKQ